MDQSDSPGGVSLNGSHRGRDSTPREHIRVDNLRQHCQEPPQSREVSPRSHVDVVHRNPTHSPAPPTKRQRSHHYLTHSPTTSELIQCHCQCESDSIFLSSQHLFSDHSQSGRHFDNNGQCTWFLDPIQIQLYCYEHNADDFLWIRCER